MPLLLFSAGGMALAACSAASPTSTPTAGPPLPSAPPSSPSPAADRLVVDVEAVGLGSYELTTVPVAVVRNQSTGHDAVDVRVDFVVDAGGRQASVDATLPRVPAATTTAIAARLELQGGRKVDRVVVAVGTWEAAEAPAPVVAEGIRVVCRTASCIGPESVTGTLRGPGLRAAGLTVTAVCSDAAGGIVGGATEDVAGTAEETLAVDEPVVVSAAPTRCDLFAAPGM